MRVNALAFGGGFMGNNYQKKPTKDVQKGKNYGRLSRPDVQTEAVDDGLVVGRNAVRELLKSGVTMDKMIFLLLESF